jgi:hypothetical protein
MSQKIPSQDSTFDFEKIWKEMDEIEPLTPIPSPQTELESCYEAYIEAAKYDDYLFGDREMEG